MTPLIHKLWVEKYRPTSFDNYIFYNEHLKHSFLRMVADQSIPHLLLTGPAGCGKTTAAKILISGMNLDSTDVLTLNASDENNVATVREKIKGFVSTASIGPFKIVHLEEADAITPEGQAIMRRLMEECSEYARFLLTANYETKISPPIRSRCQHFSFKSPDVIDVAEYLIQILAAERVKFDLDLLDKYIALGYPDIRKIVNLLQQHTTDGILIKPTTEGDLGDYRFTLLELIELDRWVEARKLLCANVLTEEWESLYRFMYENINRSPKFQQVSNFEEGIIIIAEHLYKNSIVADPEINFAAMMIRLGQL